MSAKREAGNQHPRALLKSPHARIHRLHQRSRLFRSPADRAGAPHFLLPYAPSREAAPRHPTGRPSKVHAPAAASTTSKLRVCVRPAAASAASAASRGKRRLSLRYAEPQSGVPTPAAFPKAPRQLHPQPRPPR